MRGLAWSRREFNLDIVRKEREKKILVATPPWGRETEEEEDVFPKGGLLAMKRPEHEAAQEQQGSQGSESMAC